MRHGICKLCLKMKELQVSHFMPRAMYKYLRDNSDKNPNPVVVVRKAMAATSKQVKDYLLCAECEDLFNKNGEREVLKWIWNGKHFPLGDRLSLAIPQCSDGNTSVFSGKAIGIDTEKFAYFALSVLWRAVVHEWDDLFGGKTEVLALGAAEEPVRKYLLRTTGFPANAVVIATACTDPFSIQTFYLPLLVSGATGTCFGIHTPGIHFRLFIGSNLPLARREICCANSASRPIFRRDCSQETFEAFEQIPETNDRAD